MNDIYVSDIEQVFSEVYPLSRTEEWDNVGLLVGKNFKVRGILTALDITNSIINEAIENNCNVIITHHPLIFSGLKTITNKNEKGKLLYRLIEENIAVYTAHTNVDNTLNNGTACTIFDLMRYHCPTLIPCNSIFIDGEKEKGLIVKTGEKSIELDKIVNIIKTITGLDSISYIGHGSLLINTIAICTGSAMSYLNKVIAHGDIDLYITADIKYHEAMDAKAAGLCLIDMTHYGSEKPITKVFCNILKKSFGQELNIVDSKCYEQPFSYM